VRAAARPWYIPLTENPDLGFGEILMMHRPFGLPLRALLATALALIWFQPPSHSLAAPASVVGALLAAPSGGRGFRRDIKQSSALSPVGAKENSPGRKPRVMMAARSAYRSAEGASSSPREALSFSTLQFPAQLAAFTSGTSESFQSPITQSLNHPMFLQAPSQTGAMTEIRVLFAEYIKLHAAKKIDEWRDRMFLPEAICVQTLNDGKVNVFPIADLAKQIAEEAKALDEQHEVFEDVRIEVYGNAALYATGWRLFQNGKEASKGRAFFSLVKKEGSWRIASLVWYRE
jgi:putative lumazine-binding protein